MKLIPLLFCCCFILSGPVYADSVQIGPFKGLDLSRVSRETSETLQNANEDFLLIVDGKSPKYAVRDISAPILSDGGTMVYKTDKYTLTMIQSISTFGGISGVVYGAKLQFDESFAPGNTNTIESSRFYTFDDFKKFKPGS